jgi:hypothetical protein
MSLRLRITVVISVLFILGMLTGIMFQLGNARQRVARDVNAVASLGYVTLNTLFDSLRADLPANAAEEVVKRLAALPSSNDLRIEILHPGDLVALPVPPDVAGVPDWFVWLVSAQPRQYQVRWNCPTTAAASSCSAPTPAPRSARCGGKA